MYSCASIWLKRTKGGFSLSSIERNALLSRVKLDDDTDMGHKGTRYIQVLIVYVVYSAQLFLLEPARVDDLRRLYPDFSGIYKRHVDDARFDVVEGHEFESLKERLIAVRYLLEKYPPMGPRKRTELIQTVLSEDNLQHAQQMFSQSGTSYYSSPKKLKSSLRSPYSESLQSSMGTSLYRSSKETDENWLRADVKKKTSRISDSDFLLQLKVVDDEELQVPIQTAVDLACSQLSSSIDTTVVKMTHAVLWMQEEECKRLTRLEIETERRNSLSGKLADFIRVINKVSHGRRTTYVSNYCRDP